MPRVDTGHSEEYADFIADKKEYQTFLQSLRKGEFSASMDLFLTTSVLDNHQEEIYSAACNGLRVALQNKNFDTAKKIKDQFNLAPNDLQESATRAIQELISRQTLSAIRQAQEVRTFADLPETLLDTPEITTIILKEALRLGHDFAKVKSLLDRATRGNTVALDPEIPSAGRNWLETRLSHLTESEVQEIDAMAKLFQIEPEELKKIAVRALGQARKNRWDSSLIIKKTFSIEPTEEELASIREVIGLLRSGKEKKAITTAIEKLPLDLITPEVQQAALYSITDLIFHDEVPTAIEVSEQFHLPLVESESALIDGFRSLIHHDLERAYKVFKELGPMRSARCIEAVKEKILDLLDDKNNKVSQEDAKMIARKFNIPLDSL